MGGIAKGLKKIFKPIVKLGKKVFKFVKKIGKKVIKGIKKYGKYIVAAAAIYFTAGAALAAFPSTAGIAASMPGISTFTSALGMQSAATIGTTASSAAGAAAGAGSSFMAAGSASAAGMAAATGASQASLALGTILPGYGSAMGTAAAAGSASTVAGLSASAAAAQVAAVGASAVPSYLAANAVTGGAGAAAAGGGSSAAATTPGKSGSGAVETFEKGTGQSFLQPGESATTEVVSSSAPTSVEGGSKLSSLLKKESTVKWAALAFNVAGALTAPSESERLSARYQNQRNSVWAGRYNAPPLFQSMMNARPEALWDPSQSLAGESPIETTRRITTENQRPEGGQESMAKPATKPMESPLTESQQSVFEEYTRPGRPFLDQGGR